MLTRLPGDLRLAPLDAARLLEERFAPPLLLHPYDAHVALAAAEHDTGLATRDGRARSAYEAVGVRVIVVV